MMIRPLTALKMGIGLTSVFCGKIDVYARVDHSIQYNDPYDVLRTQISYYAHTGLRLLSGFSKWYE